MRGTTAGRRKFRLGYSLGFRGKIVDCDCEICGSWGGWSGIKVAGFCVETRKFKKAKIK